MFYKFGLSMNDVFIGAVQFPDRKNASLIVERNGQAVVVGHFHDDACFEYFKGAVEEMFEHLPHSNRKHKPEDCRYYTRNAYLKCGGCLGTKEIDPCNGENCENWRPKEDSDATD